MILALDIGNTNIVAAMMDGERVLFTGRIVTKPVRARDEYAVLLRDILHIHGVDAAQLEGSILSSVVPSLTGAVAAAVELLTGEQPLIVGAGIQTGFDNRMDRPERTGADLIASCVAAKKRYPLPLAVIDMGTATTISTLDQSGAYIGNIICPGVALSLNALAGTAELLPRITLAAPERVVARNTEQSILSGLVLGNASMLDGMLDRIEEELGHPVNVVATGGLAPVILPHCRRRIDYNEHLLLLGLSDIYRMNR